MLPLLCFCASLLCNIGRSLGVSHKGAPWKPLCCQKICTCNSRARACRCSSHKGSCPWSASHTLPTLKLHQCCRSSSPSPACGSAFGWPKFDKLFLMRIAFACRAQLCQAPLSPTAAAVRGGGCPHTSSPPSQAGDMAQPSLQIITESNTVHSPWKHTPQRNTNGSCLHANTACAAQRAKGLWPQPHSLLLLSLPHWQQWEVGLTVAQGGAASIKSQCILILRQMSARWQECFKHAAPYRLWHEIWVMHDVQEISSPPAPGIPPSSPSVSSPHSLATIHAMAIALEGSSFLFGTHPLWGRFL